MIPWIQRLINRLATAGTLPTDTEEERLHKALLTFIATLTGIIAILWGLVYLALDQILSGSIVLSYAVTSLLSLGYFLSTQHYRFFRFVQLLLLLILPFVLQWSVGGFAEASAVIIWALLAPLGALMFSGPRQAVPWFIAFLGLTVTSRILHPWLPLHTEEIPFVFSQIFYGMNLAVFSTVMFLLLQYFVRERNLAKAQSEELLLNVFPATVAERLKTHPDTIADAFDDVSVLFADLVDFTGLSARTKPRDLVQLLNAVFTSFDQLAERHGLEKIKTIGDAYLVAGGLLLPTPNHLHATADMALDMLKTLATHRTPDDQPLNLRIGLHAGPAVAGVIGRKKFIYDVWGETVNTASQMESHGVDGAIQVTEDTYRRLEKDYLFTRRGPIAIKGRGELTTYLLTGKKP